MKANSTCPKDRDPAREEGLSQPVRYFRNKLAEVRMRCQFCNTETTYEGFERHNTNCRENPNAWMECTFCHEKHMINKEDDHQNSCIPFLRDKIAKKESEVTDLKRKRESDKKQFEESAKKVDKKHREEVARMTKNPEFDTG